MHNARLPVGVEPTLINGPPGVSRGVSASKTRAAGLDCACLESLDVDQPYSLAASAEMTAEMNLGPIPYLTRRIRQRDGAPLSHVPARLLRLGLGRSRLRWSRNTDSDAADCLGGIRMETTGGNKYP